LGFICKQQLINYKYARPEVDVWAAAAVLYYMLTGMPPRDFSGDDSLRAFEKPPVSIAGRHPELTPALVAVIDGALDDSGKLRYATASALKMALMAAE
jgi:serine/threonine protein kinase